MSDSISGYVANSPFASFIGQQEQSAGLPSGLLGAVGYAESTLGVNGSGGNGGGWGQFIPSTANQYGVDVNDDQSGITGSASYLSDLYAKSGSWVTALQQYGTIPSSLSGMNAGQQNAYNIASAADSGLGSGITGGMNPDTGAPLNPNITPTSPGAQQQGAAASQATAGWLTQLEAWVGGGALRVAILLIAIILLIVGVADLAFGKSAKQTITIVTKAVKSGVVE